MPLPIQFGNAAEALRQHFGLQGSARLQLDEIVVPVALVADLKRESPLDGTMRAMRTITGVALESSMVGFRGFGNYACKPLSVYVLPGAAGVISLRVRDNSVTAPVLTTLTSTNGFDVTAPPRRGPATLVEFGTFDPATLGGSVLAQFQADAVAGTTIDLTPFRLPPGQELYVLRDTVNESVRFVAEWQAERFA